MEAFHDGKISRLTLSRQFGISVCRIARRDFRSCVTILGQLLIAQAVVGRKHPTELSDGVEKILDHNF